MLDIPMYVNQCATGVAPVTMQAIIKTESMGNPLALGLNKGFKLQYQPKSDSQAKEWVDYLEKNNYNFDVGLAQINIKNIHKYGYKAVDALDPCINLKMASDILVKNYADARNKSKSDDEALKKAISAYNTGNYKDGFSNGYVQKVINNSDKPLILASNDVPSNVPPIISTSSKSTQPTVVKSSQQTTQEQATPQRSKSLLYVKPNNYSKTPVQLASQKEDD